jgi:hypothetical protein
VPITVGDTTGQQINSYDLQVTFDPTVVQPSATAYDTAGSLSSGMLITPNTDNSGHLVISAFQGTSIAGSGTLINLKFTVVGSSGQSTALTFEDYTDPGNTFHPGFQFNEGTPDRSLTNGSISVSAQSVSGTITYGNAIGAPTPRYISNVTVTGAGSPTVMTTTNAPGSTAGQYVLTGFGPGSYTITPSKSSGANGVTSFDAAKIAQHVAGLIILTGNTLVAADVSGNNAVSSFDAAEIAKYVVNSPPFGNAGQWRFYTVSNVPFPVGNTPTSRTYSSISGNIVGEDYTGLLIGEVSGNWTNTGARPFGAPPVAVTLSDVISHDGKNVGVPVTIQGSSNKGIISYEFDLRYDPSVIQPLGDPVDVAGTVSSGLTVVSNATEPGLLRVAVYGASPIAADGVLLNLRFIAVGSLGSVTPITWERFMFNEGLPRAATADGRVEITAPNRAVF